jgi:F-type H+-transporting ATPase subunit b
MHKQKVLNDEQQAKLLLQQKKNAAMAELKSHVYIIFGHAEKLLKANYLTQEAQTKLVENMLGDVKLN